MLGFPEIPPVKTCFSNIWLKFRWARRCSPAWPSSHCPPLPVTDQSQDSSTSVPTKNWPNLKLGLIFSFLGFSAYQDVKCVIQLYLLAFLIRAFSKVKGIKIATFVQIENSFPMPGPGPIPCLELIFMPAPVRCLCCGWLVLKARCPLDAAVYFFIYTWGAVSWQLSSELVDFAGNC